MNRRTLVLIALLVASTPGVVLACPVCGPAGTENTAWAYLTMTLVLSGLPLAMIGGVGYWLYRRNASHEAEDGER